MCPELAGRAKVFRADNQDRNGPNSAFNFPAYQVKWREDLARVGRDAEFCEPMAEKIGAGARAI